MMLMGFLLTHCNLPVSQPPTPIINGLTIESYKGSIVTTPEGQITFTLPMKVCDGLIPKDEEIKVTAQIQPSTQTDSPGSFIGRAILAVATFVLRNLL